jgi:DDE superfamily endonuclease
VTAADRVEWADEMRLGLRGVTRRVWAPRGVKIVQPQELRYQWIYLALAVDGDLGTLRWRWQPSMKAEAVVATLVAWNAERPSALVWDGAASHRAKAVRELGLPLVVQPPAAPELNPAERVFQEVRRAVEGRVYASLADKQTAVETFLKPLAASPQRVQRLAGWDWTLQQTHRCFSPTSF